MATLRPGPSPPRTPSSNFLILTSNSTQVAWLSNPQASSLRPPSPLLSTPLASSSPALHQAHYHLQVPLYGHTEIVRMAASGGPSMAVWNGRRSSNWDWKIVESFTITSMVGYLIYWAIFLS
ncbi:hypothetical protein G7Y89_g4269 [Cudoniella acicularis]|uniref:Uncharacterized protein n=1 Tax=Cudoniella acicularis TaxID=354080 RepID=A0A8H4W4V3_9HELO|nr:hypothetical protein G7Y89_g4269 [Cudoniella acicularis]